MAFSKASRFTVDIGSHKIRDNSDIERKSLPVKAETKRNQFRVKDNTMDESLMNKTLFQAPSFLTRRNVVHSCVSDDSTPAFDRTNFHRFSAKRKSIRQKRSIVDKTVSSPTEVTSSSNTESMLNPDIPNSKTDHLDIAETHTSSEENNTFTIVNSKRTNPKLDKIPRRTSTKNLDLVKSCEKDTFMKDKNLNEEIANDNLDYLDLSQASTRTVTIKKRNNTQEATKVQSSSEENISSVSETTEEFLDSACFIDDDYDAYLQDIDVELLANNTEGNVFKIFQSILNLYMNNRVDEIKEPVNKKPQSIFKEVKKPSKSFSSRIEKLMTKSKSTKSYDQLMKELERLVKNSIQELKRQFKKDIYKSTEIKLKQLMIEIEKIQKEANKKTDNVCECVSGTLISKLDKLLKQH